PLNDSQLSGQGWLTEILAGHDDRCRNVLGLNKHVFEKLLSELEKRAGLCDTKHLRAEEQLAIFLY
ncbi:hypothetical protein DFH11DRAFT_1474107, partial [Phellopilus nigrolimitatus]